MAYPHIPIFSKSEKPSNIARIRRDDEVERRELLDKLRELLALLPQQGRGQLVLWRRAHEAALASTKIKNPRPADLSIYVRALEFWVRP